jgi:hypothetical protein
MVVKQSASRAGRSIPGKEPRYPLNKRLGGPQNRSGRFLEKRKIPYPFLNRKILRIRHPVEEMQRYEILKRDVHKVTTVFKWLKYLLALFYFMMHAQLHIRMITNDILRST